MLHNIQLTTTQVAWDAVDVQSFNDDLVAHTTGSTTPPPPCSPPPPQHQQQQPSPPPPQLQQHQQHQQHQQVPPDLMARFMDMQEQIRQLHDQVATLTAATSLQTMASSASTPTTATYQQQRQSQDKIKIVLPDGMTVRAAWVLYCCGDVSIGLEPVTEFRYSKMTPPATATRFKKVVLTIQGALQRLQLWTPSPSRDQAEAMLDNPLLTTTLRNDGVVVRGVLGEASLATLRNNICRREREVLKQEGLDTATAIKCTDDEEGLTAPTMPPPTPSVPASLSACIAPTVPPTAPPSAFASTVRMGDPTNVVPAVATPIIHATSGAQQLDALQGRDQCSSDAHHPAAALQESVATTDAGGVVLGEMQRDTTAMDTSDGNGGAGELPPSAIVRKRTASMRSTEDNHHTSPVADASSAPLPKTLLSGKRRRTFGGKDVGVAEATPSEKATPPARRKKTLHTKRRNTMDADDGPVGERHSGSMGTSEAAAAPVQVSDHCALQLKPPKTVYLGQFEPVLDQYLFEQFGRRIHVVPPDGSCAVHALSFFSGIPWDTLRWVAAMRLAMLEAQRQGVGQVAESAAILLHAACDASPRGLVRGIDSMLNPREYLEQPILTMLSDLLQLPLAVLMVGNPTTAQAKWSVTILSSLTQDAAVDWSDQESRDAIRLAVFYASHYCPSVLAEPVDVRRVPRCRDLGTLVEVLCADAMSIAALHPTTAIAGAAGIKVSQAVPFHCGVCVEIACTGFAYHGLFAVAGRGAGDDCGLLHAASERVAVVFAGQHSLSAGDGVRHAFDLSCRCYELMVLAALCGAPD